MRTTLSRLSAMFIVLTVTTIICVADDLPNIYKPLSGETMMIGAISDNGRYVVSQNAGEQEVDNPQPAGGAIYDLTTRTLTNIPAPMGVAGINDVADDGTVAGSCDGVPAYWTVGRGWTKLPLPSGLNIGGLMAITPDARYAVGYAGKDIDPLYAVPVCYDLTTNQQVATTNLPQVDQTGTDQHQNVFYGISPDGRYILGQMSQSYLMPLSMISYVYDVQTQQWKAIGFDYNASTKKYTPKVDGLYFIDNQWMSCNGEWVTGCAYMVMSGGQHAGGEEFRAAYRYNVLTDQIEIFTREADKDITGNRITNDGVILGSTPSGSPYPTAMIRSGNFFISLDQTLQQVYGMNLGLYIGENITGAFQGLSADGLKAVMTTYDNCYIIEMPEPFDQAASRVNLLANYSLSIPENSDISKLSEIKITFDREIECMNLPSSVQLLKADGTVVRNATSTVVSPSNSHQITVTFRTQTLEAGETYRVVIPAAYIWLKDDSSVKSQEINITYIGRGNEPVKALSVTPADGSVLAELNPTSSYITVTFDTDVAAGTERAVLYNEDTDEALSTLITSIQGRQAYFFTEGEYNLYYGSNYRVEIPEGAVTDRSGSGGNQPITLHYSGSYVRPAGDDDTYLFNADCNDYDHFLFHSNQTNTPATIPASWGFVPESTWILVRDSEEDTDQALCSHSMFTPAGAADDWLVIPRLYIPDDKATLAFEAQSYLKSKADRLQVYVYESDMIYNYLSQDITDRIIAEGTLIFDEVLSPGANQETLAGEWTRYSLSLEAWAGKNIYIAFANRNYNQSAVFIDNVQVMRELDFTITNSTPTLTVAADEVEVSGILTPGLGSDEIHGVTLTLRDSDGAEIDRIADAEAVISADKPYTFAFANRLPLAIGEICTYFIDVTVGDKTSTMRYAVKNLAFRPDRRVVLEEYSGRNCGNCPLGFRAVDNIHATYGESFIPVVIRTYDADPHGRLVMGYSQYLGLDNFGAPSGRINRGDILAPMFHAASGYVFSGRNVFDAEGNHPYLWLDAVADEMAKPAEFAVDLAVDYNEATRTVTVPVTVSAALNADHRTVNLLAVVLEDNLVTTQLNNFFQENDPALGEWAAGGANAKQTVFPYLVSHVARYVLNGQAYNGTPMTIGSFTAGESYSETITATLPEGAITNPAYCSVVVMAIDGSTHEILNANTAAFGTAGISSATIADIDVRGAVGAVNISTQGEFTAKVYSTTGALIATAAANGSATIATGAYRGLAIVTVTNAGATTTHKVIIK